MAFVTVAATDIIRASHITAITDALTGISGGGNAIALTQLNSSGSYALDVRNLDSTNAYGLRVRDAADAVLLTVAKDAIVIGADPTSDLLTINANVQGKLYIGDSANADMTAGLTINQAGNDDHILALKSSDVAHAMTTVAETDTYGVFKKVTAADGGLSISGLRDTNTIALALEGIAPTDDTTKSTAGTAYITLAAYKKDTTTTQDVGADGNLVAIRNRSTTRFIFDADGSAHGDVEFVAFDRYDDIALLDTLNAEFQARKDPVRAEFGAFMQEHREALQREGIVNFYDDGPRAMVNFSKLAMLHTGALRQLASRLELAEAKLQALPAKV